MPLEGKVFISMAASHKLRIIDSVRRLQDMGYQIVSTSGTARTLQDAGINVELVRKLREGRPNLLDLMANGEIQLIFNTPSGKGARTDEGRIRSASVAYGVPCVTTLPGCLAMVDALDALRRQPLPQVRAIQDWVQFSAAPVVPPKG